MKMYNVPKEVLCIGPVGSGKTSLLRMLQDLGQPLASTVPTTGNNLLTFQVDKKQYVNINELGGTMVPIWNMYYTNCSAVIFVVDSSHLQQVSASCILFMEVLNDPLLKDVPILLVLNKTDIGTSAELWEVKTLLFLDRVIPCATQNITTVECSCQSRQGLDQIKSWLQTVSSKQ